jgi:outer membrane protein OmpA-like peptidoglycan-associated protein
MTRNLLKTTTASILAISLIQPYPAMAQIRALNLNASQHSGAKSGNETIFLAQAAAASCFVNGQVDTAACDIGQLRSALETLLRDGLAEDRDPEDDATAALTLEDRIGLLSAAIETAEREAAEAESARVAEAEAAAAAAAEAEAAARAEAETAAAAQAQAEATAQAEADALAAALAEAEAASAAEAEAAALAEAEAAAQAEAEAEAAAAAEAARVAQAEATAEAAADAEEAAAEAARVAEEAPAEETTDAEAEQAADTATDDSATDDSAEALAAALAAAEAAAATPATETAPEAATETDATAEAAAPETTTETPVEVTSTPQPETLVTTAEETEASELKDAELQAEQEAAQSLAAVATVTDTDTPAPTAAAEPEVTTQVVTEQDVRTSDQEFTAPAVTSTAAPQAVERDRGLSNLEKAGLLALGALAVGAIMSNGQRVAATSGDRVIVEDNSGRFQVLKDDDALLRRPGSTVETRRFDDGSTTTSVLRDDGSRVVTIRDASGRVLRRSVFDLSGRETLLIDDITTVAPVNVSTLPPATRMNFAATDRDALAIALREAELRDLGRTFSLRQVREIVEVRELAPQISLEDVTFRTGSAAIEPSQATQLREIGVLMRQLIRENPREIFLVEGYTDAVGSAAFNLLLSDRRAESVALALTEYFDVPPENIVVQGFGERFLKIPTLEAERQNRRVAVRRITSLIAPR